MSICFIRVTFELVTLISNFSTSSISCLIEPTVKYIKCDEIIEQLAPYVPDDIAVGFVNWFDENEDAKIDIKEYCCAISSVARGPEPERFKYIFRILRNTVAHSVNYRSVKHVIEAICGGGDLEDFAENEVEFMTDAMGSSGGAEVYNQVLNFYTDLCHLLFGLGSEGNQEEHRMITRWESRVNANLSSSRLGWLIDQKWWAKWERAGTRESNNNQSEINEVISTLKTLKQPLQAEADRLIGAIDNSHLFGGTNQQFVFDKRGKTPKDLTSATVKVVSQFTLDYLETKYGRCIVPCQRPIKDGKVELATKSFTLYTHKVENTTAAAISEHVRLPIKVDGIAILFIGTTVSQLRQDLSCEKRVNADSIRIWKVTNVNDEKHESRHHLHDDERVDQLSKTSGLLMELRKPDLSWPEDLAELARGKEISCKTKTEHTGLVNVGNSCYMNAALQALCTTMPLQKYFELGYEYWEEDEHKKEGYRGKLVSNFQKLLKQLHTSKGGSFAPTELRHVLSSKNVDLCREGEQQDSVELLQVLLDGLHEDLNRIKEKGANDSIPDSNGRPDSVVSHEHWELYRRQNNSLVVDLFNLQVFFEFKNLN